MNTVDWLSRLIAFDTTSRHSNLALIHDCADYLESLGLKPWLSHNADQSKANLFATIAAANGSTEGGLILSGHTDVVPTDGHRLAVCSMPIGDSLPNHSVIVPRKGVIELMRMLDGGDTPLRVQIGSNNIRAHVGDFIFTSKLVDGRFPDYRRVLPKNPDKHLEAGCDLLKQAFARAAILSNEKFRGVRLYVSENQLKITANNPEQEEAEEILDVTYSGAEMEIGFNVSYVLDVLNALKCENVRMMLTDSVSSVQIEDAASQSAAYVVMPMRL